MCYIVCMTNKEIEEAIYEYGHVMYRLGRMETDDKASTKEYNKYCQMKETLVNNFVNHFKSDIKLSKTLGIS